MLRKTIFLVSILYTVLLTAVSLVKINLNQGYIPSFGDKIFHTLAYVVFTLLWLGTFHFKLKMPFNKVLLTAALFSFCFGVIIELLQGWLTISRQGDVKDVIANTIGILFAVVLIWSIKKRLLKNNNTLLF
ncbi:VanZ family protein [Lacinutrix neustonica]|uniref:VanZ family protein n=1 Tax=Lacinutrix neustonica TaxID=2980107 RepID=A0A9E8MYI0_9FLAO|nr:VanZ family protein [Lacinutrix neustonica]WAC03716.1 VanZ family protein [Lacinutrix neustonica]